MQKKFLSSLGLMLLLNLLVKPLYILGIDAEVQNQVGKESYGLYFTLLNLSFIFNILIDFGINNFNNRNIAQNEQLISSHFSKLASIKGLLSLVYAAVTLGLGWFLNYDGSAFFILAVLAFNQVLVSFIQFGRSNLAALHLFKKDSIVSIADRVILIICCGVLLFTNFTADAFRIEWFVYLQTFAYGITLLLTLALLLGRVGMLKWHFDLRFSQAILKKSIPYALLILMGSIYYRVDGIMLEKLSIDGASEVGNYAQGFRFFEAAGMFAHLFAVILLPVYSRLLKDNFKEVRRILETASRLLVGTCIASAIIVFYNSESILTWRYIDVESNAVDSFIYVMIGFIGVGMFYVYGTLMTANENLKQLNLIALGGLLINLGLNFWLIPIYGAPGAAIATMFTQIFAGGLQLIFVVRHFEYGFNFRMILQFAMYIFFAILLNQFVLAPFVENGLIRLVLSAVLGLILLQLTGLVSFERIKTLAQSREE